METAIMVVIVMTAIGLVFGLILAFADKKFSIEVNPLIHIVDDILPKGQCGTLATLPRWPSRQSAATPSIVDRSG